MYPGIHFHISMDGNYIYHHVYLAPMVKYLGTIPLDQYIWRRCIYSGNIFTSFWYDALLPHETFNFLILHSPDNLGISTRRSTCNHIIKILYIQFIFIQNDEPPKAHFELDRSSNYKQVYEWEIPHFQKGGYIFFFYNSTDGKNS